MPVLTKNEWISSQNFSGEVVMAKGSQKLDGTFPPDIVYTPSSPGNSVTLTNNPGLTYSDYLAEKAKELTWQTYTDNNGVSFSGIVSSVQNMGKIGSFRYGVTVQLIVPYVP